jgi:ATP-dependent DNA helicase RecG
MNNASLRERFGIESKNSAMVSRVIKDAVNAGLVKPYDAEAGTKAMRYVPHWC